MQESRESVLRAWEEFLDSGSPHAEAARSAVYTAWHFGTGGEMADKLLELVLEGRKRATTGSLWTYEHQGERVPVPGDFSVVLDGSEVARCVIRTTSVEIIPFDQVDDGFASAEGEGDLSLDWWREAHWRYFTRELAGFGREPSADMPLVCERFELVWPLESERGA